MDGKSLIITCGCGDTTNYAKTGWKIIYGEDELPPIIEMDDSNRPLIEILMCYFPIHTRQNIDLDRPFAFCITFYNTRRVVDPETEEFYDEQHVRLFDLLKGTVL